MKKCILILLCALMFLGLCSCGVTQEAGEKTLSTTAAYERATRIQIYSAKLDEYESILEQCEYGRAVKIALKNALEKESTAIKNQHDDNHNIFWWDLNGDQACNQFEQAINDLQDAMNSDKVLRRSMEKQKSISADDNTKNVFGDFIGKYLKRFLIFTAVLIALIIALTLFKGASKKQSPAREAKLQPIPKTEPVAPTETATQETEETEETKPDII